ncbi:beta-glucosidase [Saccharopolyspora rhizosphaerae]|nr:glycoside hydrolase family 3 C-terminal domain-containing protein [Saccharopolyspora rhizosphaerae]
MTAAGLAGLATVLPTGAAAAAPGRCGEHAWCGPGLPPDERASLVLREMTWDEKISLLGGDDLFGAAGSGHTGTGHGVDRLGVPPVYYGDGPVGSRQGSGTSMPSGVSLAASFDTDLATTYGATVANEVRCKGNDVVFGPTVDVLRLPTSGRAFEGFGEDPLLSSRIGVGWAEGAHSEGVLVCVKHFAAYVQEGQLGVVGSRMLYNAVVDERTLREIYLPPFEAAVREAGVGAVMGSYNRVGGQYACEHQWLLNDLLKHEWGFTGYTIADYAAMHSTGNSLANGMDFEPWPALVYSPAAIRTALATGQAATSDVDEHAHRILRTMFAHGIVDRPAYPDDESQIDKPAHLEIAGRVAEQGMTLLRNDGLLPLDANALRGSTIAVIGDAADEFVQGGGSSSTTPYSFVTPLRGLQQRGVDAGITVVHEPGRTPQAAAEAARNADIAVVVVSDMMSEFLDKPNLDLDSGVAQFPPPALGNPLADQDAIIDAVLDANANTVVVLETGGPVRTPWRYRTRALVEAWYPGANAGTALARVLFGDVDPGGRLPLTFPDSDADTPTAGDVARYPGLGLDVHFTEGVFVGYRHYDAHEVEPAFPFGHGLSYTSFGYSDLEVSDTEVSVVVTNTGARTGHAVPQLYLGLPSPREDVPQPPRQLKGFTKLTLEPGRSASVTFTLTDRSLAYWDQLAGRWTVAAGNYRVEVGESSRDIRVDGGFTVPAPRRVR